VTALKGRRRLSPAITKLLACTPADDALGISPAFFRAKPAGIMADELPSAQLAIKAPGVLRIDIPDRLDLLQAIEHWRSFFKGSRNYEMPFPMSSKALSLEPFSKPRSLPR
jgi:hypothetical protein